MSGDRWLLDTNTIVALLGEQGGILNARLRTAAWVGISISHLRAPRRGMGPWETVMMSRADRSEKPDQAVQQMLEALAPYEASHPAAQIEARRHSPVSIRLRIIDPDFERVDKVSREETVWTFLDTLPDDVVSDITMVILLTPDEAARSVASFEFDNPVPSWLS